MMIDRKHQFFRRQGGAILVFCMAMMFVIILVSVGVSESTSFQKKNFAIGKDISLAEENAKSALIQGQVEVAEWELRPSTSKEIKKGAIWVFPLDDYMLKNHKDPITHQELYWYDQLEPWWTTYGKKALEVGDDQVNGQLSTSPRYVIEEFQINDDNSDTSQQGHYYADPPVVYYRITARATGDRDGRVTLQSIFARNF